MEKKIKLSEIQQFAMMTVNEKVLLAQDKRRNLAVAVGKELDISKEELPKWRYAEDFSYIELPEKPDKDKK